MKVRLSWVPSEAEFIAERIHLRRTRRLGVWIGSVAIAALLPVVVIGTDGGSSLWVAAASAVLGLGVGWAGWQLPRARVRRGMTDTRERYDTDPVELIAEASGLVRRSEHRQAHWAWSAVERVVVSADHVFFELSDVQAVTVPRDALREAAGDAGDEASVLAQLRAWHRGDQPLTLAATPAPGCDAWVLRVQLHPEDWVLAVRKVQRRRLGSRPLLLAIGMLLPLVLIAAEEPWRGGLDPVPVALMLAFGAAFVALGAIGWWVPALVPWRVRRGLRRHPQRMPVGEVVFGAGPQGGSLHTSRGTSRFGWGQLADLVNDADGVLLVFHDELGLPLPARAFVPSGPVDQDAWVADVHRWRVEAPRGPRLPQLKREPVGVTDVFRAPDDG